MLLLFRVRVLILATVVQVFHSEKNAAKDLLKRFPSHLGTVKTKILMFFSGNEVFVPISAKSLAEILLISQWSSRLMFFGVRPYCNYRGLQSSGACISMSWPRAKTGTQGRIDEFHTVLVGHPTQFCFLLVINDNQIVRNSYQCVIRERRFNLLARSESEAVGTRDVSMTWLPLATCM